MIGSFYPITGTNEGCGPHGEIPVELEVAEWWASNDHVHINQHTPYFRALIKIYEMSPHDELSYYQISSRQISKLDEESQVFW